MLDPVVNFGKVTVSIGYDASATSIALTTGHGALFPDPAVLGAYNVTWFDSVTFPDPSDDPKKEIVRVTAKSGDTLTVTRGQESISASTKNDAGKVYKMILSMTKKQLDDIASAINGKVNYQGIEAVGAITFNDSTHILSVASITYWFAGVKYTTASPLTIDIDSFEAIVANTTYFIYFDDASGTLKCNKTAWDLKAKVPVAVVFWNGSAGAIINECHGSKRNIDWHIWAHTTVGTRYGSGLGLSKPTTALDNQLQIDAGTIYDEDIVINITQQTTARVLYKVSASVYTWVASTLPYAGSGVQPQYLDTDTYTLTNVGATNYVSMWVYGTGDIGTPIYIIPTHAATDFNTIALARNEAPPALSGLNLSPEFKLLYKLIYKGDGNFQESVDYRNTSSLPSGGTAAISASAVGVTPVGNIVSTDVQSAIAELDTRGQNAFSGWETPAETPNGSITNFSTQYLFANGLLIVTRNGVVQKGGGNDYTQDADYFGYTFVTAPATGDLIQHWYIKNSTILIGSASKWQEMKTPSGTVNGSNAVFTTASNYISGSVTVFLNGLAQSPTTDYTESAVNQITFVVAPLTGDDIKICYQEGFEAQGNAQTLGGQTAGAYSFLVNQIFN